MYIYTYIYIVIPYITDILWGFLWFRSLNMNPPTKDHPRRAIDARENPWPREHGEWPRRTEKPGEERGTLRTLLLIYICIYIYDDNIFYYIIYYILLYYIHIFFDYIIYICYTLYICRLSACIAIVVKSTCFCFIFPNMVMVLYHSNPYIYIYLGK